jgi:polyhydroxybutyrate depolymerase
MMVVDTQRADAALADARLGEADAASADASRTDAAPRDAAIVPQDAAPAMDATLSMDADVLMDAAAADAAPPPDDSPLGGPDRPARVYIPEGHDPRMGPVVFGLHGYATDAEYIEEYLGLRAAADRHGFVLVLPEGERDLIGSRFWSATDACCDRFGMPNDDHGYVRGLIEEARARFAPTAVYVMGHSNGGYMAHRMGCDSSDLVDGVVSLAGPTFLDPDRCMPEHPVAVLHLHGDADIIVQYDGAPGSPIRGPIPGARDTAEFWAADNGCNAEPMMGPARDILIGGDDETRVEIWGGCRGDVTVELWTLRGGSHVPTLNDRFTDTVIEHIFQFRR